MAKARLGAGGWVRGAVDWLVGWEGPSRRSRNGLDSTGSSPSKRRALDGNNGSTPSGREPELEDDKLTFNMNGASRR